MYNSRLFSLSLLPVLPLWSIGHPWNVLCHFSFLILRQSVGPLARGISPSQGHYLHKQRINADRHPCLVWDSNPRFQRSSERRHFMPRPLWSAILDHYYAEKVIWKNMNATPTRTNLSISLSLSNQSIFLQGVVWDEGFVKQTTKRQLE
jgi:hypothetical protein